MLKEYDIDKLNPRPNPYAKDLERQTSIKVAPRIIEYFKLEAERVGISYQALINLYLSDCVEQHRELHMTWESKE